MLGVIFFALADVNLHGVDSTTVRSEHVEHRYIVEMRAGDFGIVKAFDYFELDALQCPLEMLHEVLTECTDELKQMAGITK